ncbi:hypothetical protein [Methanosphaera sp.]
MHNKINYCDEQLTYYQIIEKQLKLLRQTISNDEKDICYKIDW